MSTDRLIQDRAKFLADLPLALNSSLETRRVVELALQQLKRITEAEAATIFLLEPGTTELTFWAAESTAREKLEGQKMPASRGIVGWVLENQKSVLVPDASADPRFFSDVDREQHFKTRDVICVPMTVHGTRKIGAIQILNSLPGAPFDAEDLSTVEQFAAQLTLALDNALLYAALQEQNLKIQALDRRKNEMLSIITHEFRTPLTIIRSAAEMLASEMLQNTEARDRMGRTLLNGVDRLTRLIKAIKELSAIEEGKIVSDLGRTDLAIMFDDLKKFFAQAAAQRQLALHVECTAGAALVKADPVLLKIVLRQLLSNAIRFTPDGGSITLDARRATGMVKITVQDTGIGIEKSQIPLIFEKFYEVADAMQHSSGQYEFRSGGLGLGLAMVRAVLEAHGSGIEVDSEPGKGSVFAFSMQACE